MKWGTVVLTPFPFSDLTTTKRHPAVIVSTVDPQKNDVIVAFISSVIRAGLSKTDILVDTLEPDFKRTGLLKSSIVKADKLLTIDKQIIAGEIGELPDNLLEELNKKLKIVFELK